MKPASAILPVACAGLLLAGMARAEEIYKWVDKDGHTHFSSRKDEAGDAATTLNVKPIPRVGGPAAARPAVPPDAMPASPPVQAAIPKGFEPPPRTAPAPAAASAPQYSDETDAAKCRLARAILSGDVKHHNGNPIDDFDRQTARNDVRTFCGH